MPDISNNQWADVSTRQSCLMHLTSWLRILELRIPFMQGQADRIEAASVIIGRRMGMDRKDLFSLHLAAKFHELGMLAVSDAAIMKTGKLTDEERTLVNEHPHIGGHLVNRAFPDFPDAIEGIWYHHERPDGKGLYGLNADEIPPVAAIVSFVQAIEAMAQDRPYRQAMTLEHILAEVDGNVGTQFSRSVATIFKTEAEKIFEAIGVKDDSEKLTVEQVLTESAPA